MGRHFQRGVVLFDLGRYRAAIDAFTAELNDEPQSAIALAMRAASWLNLRRLRNADQDVQEAFRHDPNLSYAHYVLSCVRNNQNRIAAAEAAIRDALRIEPNPTYFCRLADIQFQRNRFSDCCRTIEEGLLIEPTHVQLHLLLAQALSALGKQQDARECLRAALSLDPQSPAAHHALGKVNLQTGDSREARGLLQEARRLNPMAHNDRDSLAIAYGRLMWPIRVVDPYLIRLSTWPVSKRWRFVALATGCLLALSFYLSQYLFLTLPIFFLSLNWLAFGMTSQMLARGLGQLAYRRDLNMAWYELLPTPARIVHPVIIHWIISVIAAVSAISPPAALLFLGFAPHFELIFIFMNKLTLIEGIVFAIVGLFGVAVPVVAAFGFLENSSPSAALLSWSMSLPVSYLLTVYRQ
jgi:tetratricopeptide (TPR) repeat protein